MDGGLGGEMADAVADGQDDEADPGQERRSGPGQPGPRRQGGDGGQHEPGHAHGHDIGRAHDGVVEPAGRQAQRAQPDQGGDTGQGPSGHSATHRFRHLHLVGMSSAGLRARASGGAGSTSSTTGESRDGEPAQRAQDGRAGDEDQDGVGRGAGRVPGQRRAHIERPVVADRLVQTQARLPGGRAVTGDERPEPQVEDGPVDEPPHPRVAGHDDDLDHRGQPLR